MENFSQVFLQNSHHTAPLVSGLAIAVGIGCFSPVALTFAAIGSGVAVGTACALGVDGFEIVQGIWGYNSILTAVAIGGGIGFVRVGWKAGVVAVLGAAATGKKFERFDWFYMKCTLMFFYFSNHSVLMQGWVRAVMSTFNAATLTLPFCVTTLVLLVGLRGRDEKGRELPLLFPTGMAEEEARSE